MKTFVLLLFFMLLFTGCNPNSQISNKEECQKLGYKYATEKKLNYRTGKYELRIICLSNMR